MLNSICVCRSRSLRWTMSGLRIRTKIMPRRRRRWIIKVPLQLGYVRVPCGNEARTIAERESRPWRGYGHVPLLVLSIIDSVVKQICSSLDMAGLDILLEAHQDLSRYLLTRANEDKAYGVSRLSQLVRAVGNAASECAGAGRSNVLRRPREGHGAMPQAARGCRWRRVFWTEAEGGAPGIVERANGRRLRCRVRRQRPPLSF